MGKTTRPEYKGRWQTVRKRILERDGHTCQIRTPKCTIHATHVDHIIPVTQGGPWWDPDNLRASCAPCNYSRIDRTRSEQWRTADTHITLVVGPPYTNKRQAIQTHATPNDLIVDYDEIAASLTIDGTKNEGLHRAAESARAAIIRGLRAGDIKVKRAFIISSHPEAEGLFPYHRVMVVDPGIDQARVNAGDGVIKGEVNKDGHSFRGGSRLKVGLVEGWYRARGGAGAGTSGGRVGSRDW